MVELLVVIAVLAILISGLIILLDPATQLRRARDGTRKSDISQIRSALEFYRSDWGIYPPEETGGGIPGITEPGPDKYILCGVPFARGGNTYMLRFPCDPNHPTDRYFYDRPTASSYTMWTCLENVNDRDKDDVDGGAQDLCPATGRVSFSLRNP